MSLAHLQCRTEQSLHIAAHRTATVQFRMPGGLSTPAQVTLLNRMDSPWVNGTAYPGDADVCQCLSAVALGRCATRLANGDGRIAILHDDKRLVAKLKSFFAQLQRQARERARSRCRSFLFRLGVGVQAALAARLGRCCCVHRGAAGEAWSPLYIPF